ncbi:hypothetical protein FPQ18DRAFT_337181 [Pyronema domesticum]|nr:hypothetical protein FPQ18DRAFT_337181 [Pyronema domesticum]
MNPILLICNQSRPLHSCLLCLLPPEGPILWMLSRFVAGHRACQTSSFMFFGGPRRGAKGVPFDTCNSLISRSTLRAPRFCVTRSPNVGFWFFSSVALSLHTLQTFSSLCSSPIAMYERRAAPVMLQIIKTFNQSVLAEWNVACQESEVRL